MPAGTPETGVGPSVEPLQKPRLRVYTAAAADQSQCRYPARTCSAGRRAEWRETVRCSSETREGIIEVQCFTGSDACGAAKQLDFRATGIP